MSKRLDKSDIFKERLRKCYKNKTDANGERITQSKIAQALGCSVDTVNAWCSGLLPSTTYLMALADYLECDVDYLLGRIDYVSHENKFISEKTGLSEKVVESLREFNDKEKHFANDYIDLINFLLEQDTFYIFLDNINAYEDEIEEIKGSLIPSLQSLIKFVSELEIYSVKEQKMLLDKYTKIENRYRIASTFYFDATDILKGLIDRYNRRDFEKEKLSLLESVLDLGRPIDDVGDTTISNIQMLDVSDKLIEEIAKRTAHKLRNNKSTLNQQLPEKSQTI